MQSHRFQSNFLKPKYWLVWLGLWLLSMVVNFLPHTWLMRLGRSLSGLFKIFLKKRLSIARRNIELAFPEQSPTQQKQLLEKITSNLGCALFDTGIAWFWSQSRLRERTRIFGQHHIEEALSKGQGLLLLSSHMMHLELTARLFTLIQSGFGVYRPHSNPFYEWLLHKYRCQHHNKLIHRNDMRGIVRALKKGQIVCLLPDHDYGKHASVFVPFFAVQETATITTPSTLARLKNVVTLSYHTERTSDNFYHMVIQPIPKPFPSGDKVKDTTCINQLLETQIKRVPEQYLWLHRRYKTTPNGTNHYKNN